jgi:glycosyltransferase involved in cell wall biosynthesis
MSIDISIIIASRHRETILWETVDKAIKSTNSKAVEIIVINDGDKTIAAPSIFAGKIHYFDNPRKGVSSARNYGVSKAIGAVYFFLDDDMWINTAAIDWITTFMAVEKNQQAVYNINWEYPPSLAEKLHRTKVGNYLLSCRYHTMWGRMHQDGNQPHKGLYLYNSIASGSLVMHKKIFKMLGGYNESMMFQGEDIDLSNQINKLNITVYAVFDITLYHNQQDRIEVDQYLARISNGYKTEFEAVKAGAISPLGNKEYKGFTIIIFQIFSLTEKAWIFLLKILPRQKPFTAFNNKLVGALSGLQRYKQWKKIMY